VILHKQNLKFFAFLAESVRKKKKPIRNPKQGKNVDWKGEELMKKKNIAE